MCYAPSRGIKLFKNSKSKPTVEEVLCGLEPGLDWNMKFRNAKRSVHIFFLDFLNNWTFENLLKAKKLTNLVICKEKYLITDKDRKDGLEL